MNAPNDIGIDSYADDFWADRCDCQMCTDPEDKDEDWWDEDAEDADADAEDHWWDEDPEDAEAEDTCYCDDLDCTCGSL